ncbi:TIGR03808 family TAT-translocated repetitive protein [Pelagibacterium montanilacus]|uniref:TIGR03808 family TAT-translocated repetitive protein n=1 Tax=Pelagibacterium montanilacus TaxID=2185280 RepID=UPI0013DEFA0B|nr:TIGR03808 family TAT-translocated repetitive protein [Pelagibacterium montanilacus]
MALTRRRFTTALPALGLAALVGPVPLRAQDLGLVPGAEIDQTDILQAALDGLAPDGGRLVLPAGRVMVRTLDLPSGVSLEGVPGASVLAQLGSGPLLASRGASHITLAGLTLDGNGSDADLWHGGLIHIEDCPSLTIADCTVRATGLNGIALHRCAGDVRDCSITTSALTGLFSYDAAGLRFSGNTIADCDNGGIRIWRGEPGPDGTLITGNRIARIGWTGGGNGQNGNGINIFRADEVIVADNHIADCAFSAVRLNATANTQVRGNLCLSSGEVAIFSEFEFSGSIISDNIVDGAAAGISMTNFSEGGRLAVCSGNIVRNLAGPSQTNPDLETPYGIAAEADALIADNLVDTVAGVGISAGWGPYLRDVSITGNLIRDTEIAITVSVAPDAGSATVIGNTISGARRHAIAGTAWWDIETPDLTADPARHPALTVSDNTILQP